MIKEKIKTTIQKINFKTKRNKILALFFLILLIAGAGYLFLAKKDKGVGEGKYFCVYKVYEEGKNTIASRGEGDEWEITEEQADWIKKNCPETIWTTKEKDNEKDKKAQKEENKEEKKDIDPVLATLPSCENKKELFTTFPVKEGDYTAIIPLGNLNPSGHTFPTDHLYVEIHDPQRPAEIIKMTGRKALVAPADMWIFGIQKSEQVGSVIDWAMDFSPCSDVKGKFGHVGTISAKLQAEIDKVKAKCTEYQTGGHTYKNCQYEGFKLAVKEGEEIGTSGSERSGMLDIWMSDYREPEIKRANQSRWGADRNYVSCFLDYYETAKKNAFYNLLRGPNNTKRTKEPRCGTVDIDIAGTAQGIWFYNLTGQVQGEDPHLALTFDNVQTDKQMISMGNSAIEVGIPSATYQFDPAATGNINRDFSQVTADGKVYCYDTKNSQREGSKSIFLTMPTATTLRLGKNPNNICGTGPWKLTNFVEFAR